ncbi:hypothetical protein [Actinoplanes awajinensis]|uniref:Uncharacterized protein n=1 Tax=Actinoplanes awajinensis subsp. mycoplanecinus TaxID=135947 RepID=A0A101JBZ2_9ACTN|nr:hypothetical protein ADL15_44905 [Actinoplanes awajinensis subsp. mycoplanecinus]
MSVSLAELTALWGPDGVIEVPADLLGDVFAPGVLPAGAALPVEVPILFTADVTVPGMTPFGKLKIEIGDEGPRVYVILGSSPEGPRRARRGHPRRADAGRPVRVRRSGVVVEHGVPATRVHQRLTSHG